LSAVRAIVFFEIYEKWIFTLKTMTSNFHNYLPFAFIASFAFVLQMLRAKPIPLKLRMSKGSLREGAVTEGD